MKRITVIGSITVRVSAKPTNQVSAGMWNQGPVHMDLGGSGYNIARHLADQGVEVALITRTGKDFPSLYATDDLARRGVDIDGVILDPALSTPVDVQVYNIMDDMEMAFGNEEALAGLDRDFLLEREELLKKSDVIAVDANITPQAIDYLKELLPEVPLFLDPDRIEGTAELKEKIGAFTMIAPNRLEAETLTGLSILSEEELMTVGQWFTDRGVKKVFITMSAGGVYFYEDGQSAILRPAVRVKHKQGAGDAFSAAILAGFLRGEDVKTMAEAGMAAAAAIE